MYDTAGHAMRDAWFQVASIVSTTGFATTDFALWPVLPQLILLLLMFLGGCAGSTAGGIKGLPDPADAPLRPPLPPAADPSPVCESGEAGRQPVDEDTFKYRLRLFPCASWGGAGGPNLPGGCA